MGRSKTVLRTRPILPGANCRGEGNDLGVGRRQNYFAATFAGRAPFKIFAKPLAIWSGTWQFSPEEIAGVTSYGFSAGDVRAIERDNAMRLLRNA